MYVLIVIAMMGFTETPAGVPQYLGTFASQEACSAAADELFTVYLHDADPFAAERSRAAKPKFKCIPTGLNPPPVPVVKGAK